MNARAMALAVVLAVVSSIGIGAGDAKRPCAGLEGEDLAKCHAHGAEKLLYSAEHQRIAAAVTEAVATKDPAPCLPLGEYRDACLVAMADGLKSSGPCEHIADSSTKDICFVAIALKHDPTVCEKVAGDSGVDRKTCFLAVAYQRSDSKLCTRIRDRDLSYTCVVVVASNTIDPSHCELVKDLERRLGCLAAVATKNNDPSLCQRIRDPHIRRECLEVFKGVAEQQAAEKPVEKPTEPTSSTGVTWEAHGDVPRQEYEACLAKATEFTKRCDEVANRWAEEDCRRSNRQSGCAHWKVGCFSPYTPGWVFSESNCSRPGFYQCAAAVYPGYIACVDGCNTAKDRAACLHQRCQAQAKISISPCGDGKANGVWRNPTGGSPEAQPGSDPGSQAAQEAERLDMLENWDKEDAGVAPRATGSATWTTSSGDASVLRDGSRAAPRPGQTLRSGDEIDTGSGSASVQLDGGHTVKLGPNTRIRFDTDNRTYHMSWGWGLFKFFILDRFRGHKVTTNTVIAGVRGTRFLMIADPQAGLDRVLVYEGTVEVEGKRSGQASVGAGRQVEVRNGVLGPVQALADSEWASAVASVEPGAGSTPQQTASPGSPGTAPGVQTPAPAPSPTVAHGATGGCQAIQGIWRWSSGAMVECFADGRCAANNGFGGPWSCLDPSGRINIQWSRPGQQAPYVDTVTLSADGWELEGVNQSGQGVRGTRPEFTGGTPPTGCQVIVGTWRWANGDVIECVTGGTCTAKWGLSGPWRCINASGRFEIRWARGGRPDVFIDKILVSPLGSYLSGKNQHGVAVGATRE